MWLHLKLLMFPAYLYNSILPSWSFSQIIKKNISSFIYQMDSRLDKSSIKPFAYCIEESKCIIKWTFGIIIRKLFSGEKFKMSMNKCSAIPHFIILSTLLNYLIRFTYININLMMHDEALFWYSVLCTLASSLETLSVFFLIQRNFPSRSIGWLELSESVSIKDNKWIAI